MTLESFLSKYNAFIQSKDTKGKNRGRRVELYHISDSYDYVRMKLFLEHISGYFAGRRSVPVSRTENRWNNLPIYFTFSNKLMKDFIVDAKEMEKVYKSALKYGFRGHSKGGQNGIFYLRGKDTNIIRRMPDIIQSNIDSVMQDLDIKEDKLTFLKEVKIVSHRPDGKRIVGAYNEKNSRIIFLDYARY